MVLSISSPKITTNLHPSSLFSLLFKAAFSIPCFTKGVKEKVLLFEKEVANPSTDGWPKD